MDQEIVDNAAVKTPIRRKYEVAFSSEDDEVEAEHIVPEPTINLEDDNQDLNSGDQSKGEGQQGSRRIQCQVQCCTLTFETTKDYQHHYNSRHMHACSICKMSLPSYHILELHVLEIHDTLFSLMAEKKPMYQCFLETCPNKFATPDERKQHCIEQHKFSQKFQFWDCKPPRNLDSKKKGKSKTCEKDATKANSKTKQNLKSTLTDSSTTEKGLLMEVDQDKSIGDVVGASNDLKSEQVKKNEDQTKSNNNRGGNKNGGSSRSMPKHIGFGRAPHRAFSNAYASAINPSKCRLEMGSTSANGNNIDMKDIEEALVSSFSATKTTTEVQVDGTN